MRADNKILACVDQSPYAGKVVDYATWAAARLDAPLELLHVIERESEVTESVDHSGALGLDTQEQLLSELTEKDQIRSKAVREQGRRFLNGLRERALATGLTEVDVRQRMGTLQEAVLVQQEKVLLYVMGRRGASGNQTRRDLGRHVEALVRVLKQPILMVSDEFVAPQRVLIAFDGTRMTRRGVAMIAASDLLRGLPIHVLMAGPKVEALSGATDKQIEWARTRLEQAGFDVHTHRVQGDPEIEIAKAVQDLKIDMLAMGAYSHSPWRSLLFGSRTSDLLRSSPIATLLLR